jgi:hypothetical protein
MKYLMFVLLAVVVSVVMLVVTALTAFWLILSYRRPNPEMCPICGDSNEIGSHGYFECECGHVWYPQSYYRAQAEAQEK